MIPQNNLARSELSWILEGYTTGSVSLDAKHDYDELGMLHGVQCCDKSLQLFWRSGALV